MLIAPVRRQGEFVVVFATYTTVFEVLAPWLGWKSVWTWVHVSLFGSLIVIVLWSHWRGALTVPGVVEQDTATEDDIYPPEDDPDRDLKMKRRFCRKCRCIKPPRAHHCSICHRCVMKMDHHCPWLNNCVGQNNHKYFTQFLVTVFLGSLYAVSLLVAYSLSCVHDKRCPPWTTGRVVLCISSGILAVFFAIFVVAMMCDQYEAVVTDTTGIESLKGWEEKDLSLVEGMSISCGEPPSWRWLIPVQPPQSSLYEWTPDEDPDAFDPRDPAFVQHVHAVRRMQEEEKRVQEGEEEGEQGHSQLRHRGNRRSQEQAQVEPFNSRRQPRFRVMPDGTEYALVPPGMDKDFPSDEWSTDEEVDEDFVMRVTGLE